MKETVVHKGRTLRVTRVDGAEGLGYPRFEIYDQGSGEELDIAWADLVHLVADLQTHIADLQTPGVAGERPTAAEVSRERWRI